jgi:hypothetical protein
LLLKKSPHRVAANFQIFSGKSSVLGTLSRIIFTFSGRGTHPRHS